MKGPSPLTLGLLPLVLMASASALPANQKNLPPPQHSPGLLQTFLARPNVKIVDKALGSLSAPDGSKATFSAIVAIDPLESATKAKGLKVHLERGTQSYTLYVDDDRDAASNADSLRQFQRALADLSCKFKNSMHTARTLVTTTGVYNRPAMLPRYCCPRFDVLNIGCYTRGEETGVAIDGAGAFPFPRLLFPKASLRTVVDLLEFGRDWLNAN